MDNIIYTINHDTLVELSNLIKVKSNIDTNIQMTLYELAEKLGLLENGIYKQITEGIFTDTEASLDIQTLRPYMFYNSQGLNKLELTNPNLILAPGAFEESTITELVLSGLDSSVTSIPDTFLKNSSITSIYIPQAEQITSIGERAIGRIQVTNLQDFTSLTRIGEQAFYSGTLNNFPRLVNVTTIGDRAFQNSKIYSSAPPNEISITLNNIKTIGNNAFDNSYIFKNAQGDLGSFFLKGNDIEIGDGAFRKFQCDEFWVNDSTFKSIGSDVFRSCNANLLAYDDFAMDPTRFYKMINLDLTIASSIFNISDNFYPTNQNDFIYHDTQFYVGTNITEVIFKPYTLQNYHFLASTNVDDDTWTGSISFYETEDRCITKEIQKYALSQATIEEIMLGGIEIIGERAFYKALLKEAYDSPTKTIQLGSVGKPVKSIALNAFEELRVSTITDTATKEEKIAIESLIINVYYDNRDYSEVGYPSEYMYGEDGKPLTTEDAPLWGISGDIAEITTIIWNEAFPESTE